VSNPNTTHLGEAIRELRERNGMTSEGLAEAAGLDKAHLNRTENHGRNLTWETLGSIAQALDLPVSVLASKAEEIAARSSAR
jgi:transcriptional regulator with XRE-family HTH domain